MAPLLAPALLLLPMAACTTAAMASSGTNTAAVEAPPAPPASSIPLFRNASATMEARLDDLVSRLTAPELIAQLAGPEVDAIPRLNISRHAFQGGCLAGLGSVNVSTSWPMPVALAASFDAALVGNVSSAMASEARGHHNTFGTWSTGPGGDLPPYGRGWDSTCLVPQLNVSQPFDALHSSKRPDADHC